MIHNFPIVEPYLHYLDFEVVQNMEEPNKIDISIKNLFTFLTFHGIHMNPEYLKDKDVIELEEGTFECRNGKYFFMPKEDT